MIRLSLNLIVFTPSLIFPFAILRSAESGLLADWELKRFPKVYLGYSYILTLKPIADVYQIFKLSMAVKP